MATRRNIQGVWLIERNSGKNMVARTYTGIEIDMDLFAPFLSATKILVDEASQEDLQLIDTENSRYVWDGDDWIMLVMAISKSARVGHMRFLLNYAITEFYRLEIPANSDIQNVLHKWTGAPRAFMEFENFLDEIIEQFEVTDESLVAGKSMDCLAIYTHLFKAILSVKLTKKKRGQLLKNLKEQIAHLVETEAYLQCVKINPDGIDVLAIDPYDCSYRSLRGSLEGILLIVTENTRRIAGEAAFRKMIFDHAMPYVKRDLERLQTYAILDDVVRHFF